MKFLNSRVNLPFRSSGTLACLILATTVFGQTRIPSGLSVEAQARATKLIGELLDRKSNRTPTQRKIDSALLDQMEISNGHPLTKDIKSYRTGVEVDFQGNVVVELLADVSDRLLQLLTANGSAIIDVVPSYRSILIRVPLANLELIANLPGVQRVTTKPQTRTHSITSQGDVTHNASSVREFYGLSGAGVSIGVLSDSVRYLADVQKDGELGTVTVPLGQSGAGQGGDTGEGTAMLQIVHDLAPKANLFFATGYPTKARYAANIKTLAADGCKVIIDDLAYFSEAAFQDDIVAQAVNDVVQQGVHYFSSAGNDGQTLLGTSGVWEGNFVKSSTVVGGHPAHSFGSTISDRFFPVTDPKNPDLKHALTLTWSDPYGKSANDYDLFLVDASGNVLGSSSNSQTGSQDPFEEIHYVAKDFVTKSGFVIAVRVSGENRFLRFYTEEANLSISTKGATWGHCASDFCSGIAAADVAGYYPGPFTTKTLVESFSSDGPRKIFYKSDGTPFTPGNFLASGGITRNKPDLTAADGISTDLKPFNPFFGTSAAAPHAGAIAALILEAYPKVSPLDLRDNYFRKAAWSKGDKSMGSGIINALLTIQQMVLDGANLSLSTNLVDGGQSIYGTIQIAKPFKSPLQFLVTLSPTKSGTVPNVITLPAGATKAVFPILTAEPDAGVITAIVSATLIDYSLPLSAPLNIQKPLLSSVSLALSSVVGGNLVLGSVHLATPAPTGGAVIGLKSDSPNLATPSSTFVAAGKSDQTFTCTTLGVDSSSVVTVTAKYGQTPRSATVQTNPASLKSFKISPATVYGGSATAVTGTVTFDGMTGPFGAKVSISKDAAELSVPASVILDKGNSTATFSMTDTAVSLSKIANVTASLNKIKLTSTLTLLPVAPYSITLSSTSIYGGSTLTGKVALNAPAPTGGLDVQLLSSSPNAIVPASVHVAVGVSTFTFSVSTTNPTSDQTVTIKASTLSATQSKSFTLKAIAIGTVAVTPITVVGGSGTLIAMTVGLNSPAPAGGLNVVLSPLTGTAFFPASSGHFAAGELTHQFPITHVKVSTTTIVKLTATLNKSSKSANLTVTKG